ncbi:zinc finger, CCHC-type containing protein [Tanacetum coccineum]|uniref:Zinc finger, CCHC-type containing protein n=1 Tax=Tanacetum coccineum TaxID=301880 RepID=A0ABQ4ZHJ5_9ASTR
MNFAIPDSKLQGSLLEVQHQKLHNYKIKADWYVFGFSLRKKIEDSVKCTKMLGLSALDFEEARIAAVVAALTAAIAASSGHRKDEFNMKFCMDESPQRRFIGVVTGVRWDEAIDNDHRERISSWEIDLPSGLMREQRGTSSIQHYPVGAKRILIPPTLVRGSKLTPQGFPKTSSNWLERLPAGSITIWEDLTTHFLAQFFLPGRTAKLRNDILMFQQHHEESLSEAWTRFKDLLQKVPHHGIDRWLQI